MLSKPRGTGRTAAVVGGGISGLCAAYEFQLAGAGVDVFEASNLWGGKIQTSLVGERPVDAGPDTFLARAPEGVQLCRELGVADKLVSPIAKVPAYIHLDGQLLPLPSGTVLGIPTDYEAVRLSGLVSDAGIVRANADLTLPATKYEADCSLGWYCRKRLGDEVTERLIDPLLGGINASNIDELSLEAAFPALATIARSERSLLQGLQKHRASIGPTLGSSNDDKPAPVFYSLPGGMANLTDRLLERLKNPAPGETAARLHLEHPITDIEDLSHDMVVLATPAPAAAKLISQPEASRLLERIEYTTVSQVTFAFDSNSVQPALDASGILFPSVDGLMATAATWLSSKWRHYTQNGQILIRVSSGRAGDARSTAMSDDQLSRQLLSDLGRVVTISAPPTAVRVQRWPQAFPKYTPGHAARCQQIEADLQTTRQPAIRLAGAAYHGIGIPACIRSGRSAAIDLLRADKS